MTVFLPPQVSVTYRDLGRALDEATETGLRIPCREDPRAFFAGTAPERRIAAARCGECPLLNACREYAEAAREQFGVWGGTDRETPVSANRRSTAA